MYKINFLLRGLNNKLNKTVVKYLKLDDLEKDYYFYT